MRKVIEKTIAEGGVVVDLRAPGTYGEGHLPGSICVGIVGKFSTWAAWVVPYDVPIVIVSSRCAAGDAIGDAVRGLIRVGLDRIAGQAAGGVARWRESGRKLAVTEQIAPRELSEQRSAGSGPHVVDVRGDGEWQSGHVPGALHVTAAELATRVSELPEDGRALAVVCAGGYRSTIAASLLERAGRSDVLNVAGGMAAWSREQLELEQA